MHRDVDLVNLREANTVFRNEVVKNVRRIHCADPYAADVFEMLIGFRNVLVHQYQQLDLGLMVDVIENHLDDLLLFTEHAVKAA